MQFPLTLLFSAVLVSTASAATLNFLTWNCNDCQDRTVNGITCSQKNYQVQPAGTCIALRTDGNSLPVRGVELFNKQDCGAGRLELYDGAGCTGNVIAYTLEEPLPGSGPTCHNEAALTTKRYFKIVC